MNPQECNRQEPTKGRHQAQVGARPQACVSVVGSPPVDIAKHKQDPEMIAQSEDKMAVFGYIMTQYTLKAGRGELGEKGNNAAVSELTQLHVMDTWRLEDPVKLSRTERVRALLSLIFLEEKRDGKVKGRTCANGASQRAYIPREKAALPMVVNESVFIISAIATFERRLVRCFDMPGAFLHTNSDENVLMISTLR